MTRLLLLLSIASALSAQDPVWFTALSASDDGQVLSFASPLILRGSNASFGMRAYRYSSAGFEEIAKLADYDLDPQDLGIDLSSDASTVAWWNTSLGRISGALLPDRVLLGKTPLKVLSSSLWDMRVQVPFDAPLGDSTLHLPGTSPFEQVIPVGVQAVAPIFLGLWEAGLAPDPTASITAPLIVKGDFSGLATSVAPGDVLVFYMAGVGTVSPAVATGAPAPARPPALATEPISITLDVQTTVGHGPYQTFTPEVSFLGLAPGMTGVYQVTLKIPESLGLIPGDHTAGVIVRHTGSATAYAYFKLSIK